MEGHGNDQDKFGIQGDGTVKPLFPKADPQNIDMKALEELVTMGFDVEIAKYALMEVSKGKGLGIGGLQRCIDFIINLETYGNAAGAGETKPTFQGIDYTKMADPAKNTGEYFKNFEQSSKGTNLRLTHS
mmetsp:Transcript_27068/g.31224  ORF Transcript_27068/g.31224 Transcript_27068/m.31224 type:complete len:130 (+) Transcript_27068:46-435(+)